MEKRMASTDKTLDESRSSANNLLAAGASAGAIGTAGALITGAVCPLCIVATPVLLGVGLVKRMNIKRKQKRLVEVEP